MRSAAQSKIVTPKGSRYPGSGRPKGYVNPVSVEARVLVSELVNNPNYQRRLRRDFELRKLHPTIEALVWAYAVGKPRQDINLSGSVDINATIEAEKRLFVQLELPELEALAAESASMLERAKAAVLARNGQPDPQYLVVEGETLETGAELLGKVAGSDNLDYVASQTTSDETPITPADTEVSTPSASHDVGDDEST